MNKYALAFIGAILVQGIWARNKSVSIFARSVGCRDTCVDCRSYARVNDVTYTHNHPGLRIVALNSKTGNIDKSGNFQNLKFIDGREKLKLFLKTIKPRSLVVMTMHTKCSSNNANWYNFIRENSNLTLKSLKTDSYETAVVITCEQECPHGSYSQKIPFYRFEEAGYGPLQESANITLFLEHVPKTSLQKTEEEEHTNLFIIIGSLSALCFLIITITAVCFCYKQYRAKAITRPPKVEEPIKINGKIKNWLRQKHQDEINKEISKSNASEPGRKEFDNRGYRGDVVRFSITSLDTFNTFQTIDRPRKCFPNHDERVYEQTQDNNTDSQSQASITSSMQIQEQSIYLEPIEQHDSNRRSVRLYSKLKDALTPNKESKSLNNLDTNTARYEPSSSFQLFHSKDNINAIKPDTLAFAEYLKVETHGPMYKKPSNVLKHDPPTHIPEIVPYTQERPEEVHDYELPSSQNSFDLSDLEVRKELSCTSLSEPHTSEAYGKLVINATKF